MPKPQPLAWHATDETGARFQSRIACWLTLRVWRHGQYWVGSVGDCSMAGGDGKPLRFARRDAAQSEAYRCAIERCRALLAEHETAAPAPAGGALFA